MQILLAEWRKRRAFREVWVGYILAFAFLTLALYMQRAQHYPVSTEHIQQQWISMQQNIYTYGATLTAFLLVAGLSRLLSYERECGTDSLIFTAKYGAFHSYTAKAVLAVQYCAAVTAVIGTASIIANGSAFGFEGALGQMTEGLYFRQAPVSNLLYCVTQYVFLFLGALYFAGFVMLIASLVKRGIFVIFISGGCFMIFLSYYYALRYWIQGTWLDRLWDILFYYGWSGFMLQESFSRLSASADMWSGLGDWSQVWRPVLLALAMTIAELTTAGLIWGRRARR